MSLNTYSPEEVEDLKLRKKLQEDLQTAIRRSASASEVRDIQVKIEKLNKKIESYAHRLKT